MRWLAALMLLCSTAHAEDVRCSDGTRTTLTIQQRERPTFLRHDQPIGKDRLILRAGMRELMHEDSDDFWWMCLGFSRGRGHLVGAQAEHGAVFVLGALSYLSEDGKLSRSAFTREGYEAYAALVTADARYVAFVGGRNGELALQLLDTREDTVRTLGQAPAPPAVKGCKSASGWVECVEGYTELGPEVWKFEGDVLVVHYDTSKRAGKRQVRRFKL